MTIFLNMVAKKEGNVYPSIFLKLEDGEEITLSYVQYIYISPNLTVKVQRVNTDLSIYEDKTYTNVKWVQIIN